jgi:hypothetical protein
MTVLLRLEDIGACPARRPWEEEFAVPPSVAGSGVRSRLAISPGFGFEAASLAIEIVGNGAERVAVPIGSHAVRHHSVTCGAPVHVGCALQWGLGKRHGGHQGSGVEHRLRSNDRSE